MDDHTYRSAGRTGSGEAKFRTVPVPQHLHALPVKPGASQKLCVRQSRLGASDETVRGADSRDWDQIGEDLQQTADVATVRPPRQLELAADHQHS
jgi:hypothetical protein